MNRDSEIQNIYTSYSIVWNSTTYTIYKVTTKSIVSGYVFGKVYM